LTPFFVFSSFLLHIAAFLLLHALAMTAIADFLQNVPQPLQWGLAGIGALFLGSKILSYLQLVLSAFVLGGTNVSGSYLAIELTRLTIMATAAQVWKVRYLGCHHRCL
jgi:hypothetical protein